MVKIPAVNLWESKNLPFSKARGFLVTIATTSGESPGQHGCSVDIFMMAISTSDFAKFLNFLPLEEIINMGGMVKKDAGLSAIWKRSELGMSSRETVELCDMTDLTLGVADCLVVSKLAAMLTVTY